MRYTKEGGTSYEHALDHGVEFFSKAGSLFAKRESFYDGEESALSLFQKVWIVDKPLAFKLLLWVRDCRGGAGNRSGFRECLRWVAERDPEWVSVNMKWIPEVGRWDDLRALFPTPLRNQASALWGGAILGNNLLAAKWADRSDLPILYYLKSRGVKDIGDFRRLLAKVRKDGIVEHKMCTRQWGEIEYPKVPSVAMARYTNAFSRHDEERFAKYKEALAKGETTVHASVLFPHDCVRTCLHGDAKIADAQFEALPNYMEEADERVIVIADTSGSMSCSVSGSVEAVHISQGMALYCSAKMPKDSPFYKKFIGFCSEGKFKDWNGMSFSQAVNSRSYSYYNRGKDGIFDGAVGSTRIDKALKLIVDTAKFFSLPDSYMPTTLLIVSDMQFHNGGCNSRGTEVEKALRLWTNAGYSIPKIVYWNTAGYAGAPTTSDHKGVALVSGFSPAILTSIFSGTDLSPKGVMLRALEKYEIEVP